jgi:hypothetical protein
MDTSVRFFRFTAKPNVTIFTNDMRSSSTTSTLGQRKAALIRKLAGVLNAVNGGRIRISPCSPHRQAQASRTAAPSSCRCRSLCLFATLLGAFDQPLTYRSLSAGSSSALRIWSRCVTVCAPRMPRRLPPHHREALAWRLRRCTLYVRHCIVSVQRSQTIDCSCCNTSIATLRCPLHLSTPRSKPRPHPRAALSSRCAYLLDSVIIELSHVSCLQKLLETRR